MSEKLLSVTQHPRPDCREQQPRRHDERADDGEDERQKERCLAILRSRKSRNGWCGEAEEHQEDAADDEDFAAHANPGKKSLRMRDRAMPMLRSTSPQEVTIACVPER